MWPQQQPLGAECKKLWPRTPHSQYLGQPQVGKAKAELVGAKPPDRFILPSAPGQPIYLERAIATEKELNTHRDG